MTEKEELILNFTEKTILKYVLKTILKHNNDVKVSNCDVYNIAMQLDTFEVECLKDIFNKI